MKIKAENVYIETYISYTDFINVMCVAFNIFGNMGFE